MNSLKKITTLLCFACATSAFAQIEQIWITQSDSDAKKVAINWFSKEKGDTILRFGTNKHWLKTIKGSKEATNLHSVEVDISKRDVTYYYSIQSGDQKTTIKSFKAYPSKGKELRIACIGNLGYLNPKFNDDLKNIIPQKPHLLLSCGDNVSALHLNRGKPVAKDDINAYLDMINRNRELFESTIFISILGNHDKEFKSRGRTRPDAANPVYDIDATAFRKFFKFPDPEWYWTLTFAEHNLKLVGLDLCHISDHGTGWQACHEFDANSEQFKWYQKIMNSAKEKFVVTLYNESNRGMRGTQKGIWNNEFVKGSLCVSGYGYYMELAQTKDGMPYVNNSLNAGAHYKDKQFAVWSERIGGFTMLVVKDGKLTCKFYDGKTGERVFEKEINSRIK